MLVFPCAGQCFRTSTLKYTYIKWQGSLRVIRPHIHGKKILLSGGNHRGACKTL